MKDYFFGFATLAFVIAIGGVFWQLLSTESRPLAAPSVSISDGGDLLHQQNLEAQQAETNQLLASVIDTLILVNPSPTPEPTVPPTSTPKAVDKPPSCTPSTPLEDGKLCKPFATSTPSLPQTPTPTPEPCATTFAKPVTYSTPPCYFGWTPTPTPDLAGWSD